MPYGMMGYGGMGFFGAFIMLIFWVIVILLVYHLIKRLIEHDKLHSSGKPVLLAEKSPLDIAKERYAKGEITKEELEEIKNNLV